MTTRFKSIGLVGGLSPTHTTQPAQKTIVVKTPAIASGAAQSTGVFLPPGRTYLVRAYVNVITAEATGTTKTISVGTTSTANSILSGVSVAAAGYVGVATSKGLDEGEEITYTLASANFAELDAEVVITIEYNENS